jgi:hypothetical protein
VAEMPQPPGTDACDRRYKCGPGFVIHPVLPLYYDGPGSLVGFFAPDSCWPFSSISRGQSQHAGTVCLNDWRQWMGLRGGLQALMRIAKLAALVAEIVRA